MNKRVPRSAIRLRGVRQNNLKNFDLDLPLDRLIVVTGLSGSGKSSLAFDTLFAEGQRRYIETFSPYARQFFDRMDKPQVDRIEGIPPAIAIEQKNTVKTTRSTVGTMTEICDYMKLLWPSLAQLYCRKCGQLVREDSPQIVWETISATLPKGSEVLITFKVPLSEKLSLAESLALVAKQGYQRLLWNNQITRIEDLLGGASVPASRALIIIQDRLKLTPQNRARFIEACEQAYAFGKGRVCIYPLADGDHLRPPHFFSRHFHCAYCDIEYREPTSALFSFNHPVGACPSCRGFGRIITIDYNLAVPDYSKTLAEGIVKPWQSGMSAECQTDLLRMCRHYKIPTNVPFNKLPQESQDWIINGDPEYGKDQEHEWPHAWYGVKGYFRWLESKAYKMHVRVLLSRYRAYSTCPACQGQRFQPESLLYQVPIDSLSGGASVPASHGSAVPVRNDPAAPSAPAGSSSAGFQPAVSQISNLRKQGNADDANMVLVRKRPGGASVPASRSASRLNLADFYKLPITEALVFVDAISARFAPSTKLSSAPNPLSLVLQEVRSRLQYLLDVGLGYLTLDRPTRSLSGGETERVNLTTCLGTRLVNTLYVLDEPTVGLHPRDTSRLVKVLNSLRDCGNTVLVVEHEPAVMRAADQIVDLGPGQGEAGGQLVFQGPLPDLLRSDVSLTGQYLSGRKQIQVPPRRQISDDVPPLVLKGARHHNLKDITIEIPTRRFVCVTGVSGSGKTTLVREILLPALQSKLSRGGAGSPANQSSRNGGGSPPLQRSPGNQDAQDSPEENGDSRNDDLENFDSNGHMTYSSLTGWEQFGRVILVDQSPLGKTPRSTPAVYIGAFDHIRDVFASTELARQRGLAASAFSFNSAQGQCERCRGAGFEKIEMQFLSDVFIRCPECGGGRYRPHILEVKLRAPDASSPNREWSIADFLQGTVDSAVNVLMHHFHLPSARRALASLKLLQEVGLGYLRLGQPINTLSGGESQRLKLVGHLAEFAELESKDSLPTFFLFDEPTTGLHFDDVRVLLDVFQRLVSAGHSVLVIEHNLEVIKSSDWLIDLGPEAGADGGTIVAQGTPEQVMASMSSHTGQALREYSKDLEVATIGH